MNELQRIIENAFERRAELDPATAPADLREAVEETLGLLELGRVRVAEPRDGAWTVNAWLKKAVLLSFRLNDSVIIRDGYTNYFDKAPIMVPSDEKVAWETFNPANETWQNKFKEALPVIPE